MLTGGMAELVVLKLAAWSRGVWRVNGISVIARQEVPGKWEAGSVVSGRGGRKASRRLLVEGEEEA
jgi:hypothetical protein